MLAHGECLVSPDWKNDTPRLTGLPVEGDELTLDELAVVQQAIEAVTDEGPWEALDLESAVELRGENNSI